MTHRKTPAQVEIARARGFIRAAETQTRKAEALVALASTPTAFTIAANGKLYATVDGLSSLVADDVLIALPHSGDGQRTAAGPDRAWVVWASSTPPNDRNGTVCWAAEYDGGGIERWRGQIGVADPARPDARDYPDPPDEHDQPQIIRGDDGTLHLLLGAHHGRVFYARSNSPDTLADGWTEWIEIGDRQPSNPAYGYTYPAVVLIGDTLHVVARWSSTPGPTFIRLVYFRLDTQTLKSSPHTVIATGPDPHEYAVFYQSVRFANGTLCVRYHTHYYTDTDPTLRADGGPQTWEKDV